MLQSRQHIYSYIYSYGGRDIYGYPPVYVGGRENPRDQFPGKMISKCERNWITPPSFFLLCLTSAPKWRLKHVVGNVVFFLFICMENERLLEGTSAKIPLLHRVDNKIKLRLRLKIYFGQFHTNLHIFCNLF